MCCRRVSRLTAMSSFPGGRFLWWWVSSSLQKHGLVIIPDGTPNGDVHQEPVVGAITVVSQEAAQVLESAGEGPLGKTPPLYWLGSMLSSWTSSLFTSSLEKQKHTRSVWALSRSLTGRNLGTLSSDILDLGKPALGSLTGSKCNCKAPGWKHCECIHVAFSLKYNLLQRDNPAHPSGGTSGLVGSFQSTCKFLLPGASGFLSCYSCQDSVALCHCIS